MSENPYVPPSADLGAPETTATGGRGDFEIGECLSDAWSNTWSNFPLWLGVGVVFVLASLLSMATVIGLVLLLPVLCWGATRFVLAMHDGDVEFGDVFAGFSQYGTALRGFLVVGLVTFLIGLLGQSVELVGELQSNAEIARIGWLINLAVAIVILPRLYFAYFYVVDRGMAPMESIRRSWDVTGPIKWKVVGLLLLSIVVVLVGLIALVVGVIPASVITYLMWASAFRQLAGSGATS